MCIPMWFGISIEEFTIGHRSDFFVPMTLREYAIFRCSEAKSLKSRDEWEPVVYLCAVGTA